MGKNNEKQFIVLAGTEIGLFTLGLATESQVQEGKSIISLIEIDYDCTGYEILNICYGIEDSKMRHVGNIPSFILPYIEAKEPEKFIGDKNSVIGHIKYCLEYCKNSLSKNTCFASTEDIRKESIQNFRALMPILL